MIKKWQHVACLIALAAVAGLSDAAAWQLKSRPASEWIESLERAERVERLRVDFIVSNLGVKPGQTVVDVGAGPGVFSFPLAQGVSPGGKVYAVELDQGFLDHITMRAKERNVTNVQTVLGKPVDPNLPAKDVDLALIHDVLHHVADRAGYLKALAPYLKGSGRVAIVELSAEKGSHKDEPALVVTKPQVDGWMADAGFTPIQRIEGLPDDKWFTIYARRQTEEHAH